MARTPAANPNLLVKAWISPELKGKLYLHLFSEVEGRIPQGKISEFVAERIREFFDYARLDLTPFGFPAGYYISGPKPMVEELKNRLMRGQDAIT